MQEDNNGSISELTRTMSSAMSSLNQSVTNLVQTVSSTSNLTLNSSTSAAGVIDKIASDSRTDMFTTTYSGEKGIIADIRAANGANFMNMTSRESTLIGQQRMKDRGMDVLDIGASMAITAFGGFGAGAAYSFIAKPAYEAITMSEKRERFEQLAIKQGHADVNSIHSRNKITGTGWSKEQSSDIGWFLGTADLTSGFSEEGITSLVGQGGQGGYFKGANTVGEYKKKVKELMEGTERIMKALHTSQEEAVDVMNNINKMKVSDKTGFIGKLNQASAMSGLSSRQLTGFASSMGGQWYNQYGMNRESSAGVALSMAGLSEGNQNRLNATTLGAGGLMGDVGFQASFMKMQDGKMIFDRAALNQYAEGGDYLTQINKGASFLGGLTPQQSLDFNVNGRNIFTSGAGPSGVAAMSATYNLGIAKSLAGYMPGGVNKNNMVSVMTNTLGLTPGQALDTWNNVEKLNTSVDPISGSKIEPLNEGNWWDNNIVSPIVRGGKKVEYLYGVFKDKTIGMGKGKIYSPKEYLLAGSREDYDAALLIAKDKGLRYGISFKPTEKVLRSFYEIDDYYKEYTEEKGEIASKKLTPFHKRHLDKLGKSIDLYEAGGQVPLLNRSIYSDITMETAIDYLLYSNKSIGDRHRLKNKDYDFSYGGKTSYGKVLNQYDVFLSKAKGINYGRSNEEIENMIPRLMFNYYSDYSLGKDKNKALSNLHDELTTFPGVSDSDIRGLDNIITKALGGKGEKGYLIEGAKTLGLNVEDISSLIQKGTISSENKGLQAGTYDLEIQAKLIENLAWVTTMLTNLKKDFDETNANNGSN